MMELVKHTIEALRVIAAQPDAATVGLCVAQNRIDECVRPLSGSVQSAAIDDIRNAAVAAIKDHPAQTLFWEGLVDYLTYRCRAGSGQ